MKFQGDLKNLHKKNAFYSS